MLFLVHFDTSGRTPGFNVYVEASNLEEAATLARAWFCEEVEDCAPEEVPLKNVSQVHEDPVIRGPEPLVFREGVDQVDTETGAAVGPPGTVTIRYRGSGSDFATDVYGVFANMKDADQRRFLDDLSARLNRRFPA